MSGGFEIGVREPKMSDEKREEADEAVAEAEEEAAGGEKSPAVTDNVGSVALTEEDIAGILHGITGQTSNTFLPLMQGMVQCVVSKRVLLKPLRTLLDRYGPWLERNGATAPVADRERYERQRAILTEMCDELTCESDTDRDSVRLERSQRVMELMLHIQELGNPPPDIVEDIGPRIHFDERGLPVIPDGVNINNLEELCLIM